MPKRYRVGQNGAAPIKSAAERDVGTADRIRSVGVTLRSSEIRRLDAIADDLGVSRNALMRWAIRHVARQIADGAIEPPVTERVKTVLELPE